MDEIERHNLATQEVMSCARNYNRWIADTVAPFVGRRLLDVGSSIGNITQHFLERERVVALDPSESAVRALRERFGEGPSFRGVVGDVCDADLMRRLQSERFDTVLCLNVLEHIEADDVAIRRMRDVLVDGGRLVLMVPALPCLYGTMDRLDNHFRRYTPRSLRRRLADGWVVERVDYFNAVGILGWFVNGRILRREVIPEDQLARFDRVVPILRRIEAIVPLPVGQSLVAVARKA